MSELDKDVIKEFEEMINEVCGHKTNVPNKGRPTHDFYDIPMHHKDFMDWYNERDREKYSCKIVTKCDCGVSYTVYTEPGDTLRYVHTLGEGTAASPTTDWTTQYQTVEYQRFYCWKCGRPFTVTGSKIMKVKSNQLEVVL